MKKILKSLLVLFAMVSVCLATSTVLNAGSEDNMTEIGDKNVDSSYCVYQTMSHCPNAGLNYSCKISRTSEVCRRHVCCQPF